MKTKNVIVVASMSALLVGGYVFYKEDTYTVIGGLREMSGQDATYFKLCPDSAIHWLIVKGHIRPRMYVECTGPKGAALEVHVGHDSHIQGMLTETGKNGQEIGVKVISIEPTGPESESEGSLMCVNSYSNGVLLNKDCTEP